MLKPLLLTLLLSTAFTATAHAQTIFVDNAKIATQTNQGTLESADMIVTNGVVTRIGAELAAPDNAVTISGDSVWVTPGLFAPYTHIGLVDISLEGSTNDIRSGEAKTSAGEIAADSFNPKAASIGNTRIEGITRIGAAPAASHHVVAGTGLIATTSGDFDSIADEKAFIFVRLGESGAEIAGGSRAAALAQLRASLDDALAYPGRFGDPDSGDTLSRYDAAAMAAAARGQIPLMIEADRAADILRIAKLKSDYNRLDIIIIGATEAWMVSDQVKAAGLKLVIDPHENLPGSFEKLGARADHAALLAQAKIPFAFMTRTADLSHNVRVLAQHAGNAVGEGLSWDDAMTALTQTPLSWFNIEPAGQIRRGQAANFVVWDGDPLNVTSAPTHIYIDGVSQSLESRQTKLRDRYNPLTEDKRPHKYR